MSDWMDRARCANLGMKDKAVLELFYPDVGSNKTARHSAMLHRRAKRICAKCPVRMECLKDALLYEAGKMDRATGKWARRLPWGVWGGHTDQERHAECRTVAGRHACPPKVQEHAQRLERKFQSNIVRLLTREERRAS
jgi:hypothetical protein